MTMRELSLGQSTDRRRGERRNRFSVDWTAVPKFVAWIPLTLVVLSLAGLVLTPLVMRERTKHLRLDMRSAGEPTRLLLGDLRFGLAREQVLAQRFAVAPETTSWAAYQRAVVLDDSVLTQLNSRLHSVGREAQISMDTLHATVNRWREVAAVDGRRSPEDLIRRSIARNATYEDLLGATLQVDTAVAQAMQTRRNHLDSMEGLELKLTILFVATGCIASAAVLVLTLRGRHLRRLLRRRAEEETTLRRLAGALSGALTVNEVAELTVSAALQSSRVGGAYVTSAIDGHLLVLAARGSCTAEPGAQLPLPHWLYDRRNSQDPHIFTTEVRKSGARIQTRDGYDARSLLVVPMRHEGEVIGTLALASAGGRRTFGDSAVRYGRALGDLAAVAMHRAAALERERRARSEAEGAVRTRDAVVSMVSHDLRNPLTAILGGADYLLELLKETEGRENERLQLARLKHAAASMNRLISDLLDITRLESGPLPLQRVRLTIDEVVDEVVEMFQAVLRGRRITLERVVASDLPAVWGDRDRLAQALSNLLGNAVKFTPEGGRITVGVERHERGVKVLVRDTGQGIPAEHLPHLFDRFWQATHHDRRGLGLGLSIVKAIVDAHGGTVSVDSTPRQGTTIYFTVPAAAPEVATELPKMAVAERVPREDVLPLPTPDVAAQEISSQQSLS
jgi:signal transduction histidine kinase